MSVEDARAYVYPPSGAGIRDLTGKTRTDLLPPMALLAAADAFGYGAHKYPARNWEKGLDYSGCYGAAMRHILQWWAGETNNEESGFSHLAHAVANLMMLIEYEYTGQGVDDRPHVLLGEHDEA